ncbi:molybdopterin converting factor subunit 1 [Thiothrix litoralis]|jgi:molybdopterin synthase sulfur carrier subunit|uniref:Molybdopterin synthase sulfur carrier subunit n=1 Tax=Thiothrix litoralis TaxID=2891210 RepID=A0ABX7WP54_9GAMM|nr:molybdopterin converting factor subunit 1 [Thiothrix litoralis]QTR45280.1 molybdopterin converting factor subunit 1 [Thiothrix litoralis]
MSIKVLFFASLRERLGVGQVMLDTPDAISVQEVWQRSSGENVLPSNVLVAVNQVYANAAALVQPGDEVAFFPPVTGG